MHSTITEKISRSAPNGHIYELVTERPKGVASLPLLCEEVRVVRQGGARGPSELRLKRYFPTVRTEKRYQRQDGNNQSSYGLSESRLTSNCHVPWASLQYGRNAVGLAHRPKKSPIK